MESSSSDTLQGRGAEAPGKGAWSAGLFSPLSLSGHPVVRGSGTEKLLTAWWGPATMTHSCSNRSKSNSAPHPLWGLGRELGLSEPVSTSGK